MFDLPNTPDSPSFYAIIPAHVRYSKLIEPGAKILYAEITALCSQRGFCWATNQYFSDLYDVDISTIKRWISSLVEQSFLEIETEKEGMRWKRKIWVSKEIKEMFTKAQKCPPPSNSKNVYEGSKMSSRRLKNEPRIIKETNNKEKEPPNPPEGEMVSFGSFVKLSKKDYETMSKDFGTESLKNLIDEMNDYLLSTGKRPYKDFAAALRNWNRRRVFQGKNPTSASPAAKEVVLKEVEKRYPEEISKNVLVVGYNYVEFVFGRECKRISIHENAFNEQLENNLRKMNKDVSWLRSRS